MPDIPVEFALFALTVLGIALVHHRALTIALTGLVAVTLHVLLFGAFRQGPGLPGLAAHLAHEWVLLANLAALLLAFSLLSRHFEESQAPKLLPLLLPRGWPGPFVLLVVVFVLSSFLDNIAAALIGGAMARTLFPAVHLGFVAALVAAANAGGSGSVVGDTTTTMMWISGVAPADVVHAYVAAAAALCVSGAIGAWQQHRLAPVDRAALGSITVDWPRLGIVTGMLAVAVTVNVTMNAALPAVAGAFPVLGAALWTVLLLTARLRRPDWSVLRPAASSTAFLLALVLTASMMPVERLPAPTWQATLRLGFVSAVFDNIPLTALALEQGGYDWGLLAYAVGFGGSMMWFGSSAGVALSAVYPAARSVPAWIRHGWHVALAYVVGFFVLLAVCGWQPHHRQIVQ